MRRPLMVAALAGALLITGCSRTERDWSNALSEKSSARYRSYIAAYPQGPHLAEAKQKLDDVEWKTAIAADTVDAYGRYLAAHPTGLHVTDAHSGLEKQEWTTAFSGHSESALLACMEKYPHSQNAAKAQDEIWRLKWPPVDIRKADSVTICSKGECAAAGKTQMVLSLGGNFTGTAISRGVGPSAVYIWRDFAPSEIKSLTQRGLRPGMAFLKKDKEPWKFIRAIDLTKTDDAIVSEFGAKYSPDAMIGPTKSMVPQE